MREGMACMATAMVERWQAGRGVGSWRGNPSQVGLAYLARWQSKMHDVLCMEISGSLINLPSY